MSNYIAAPPYPPGLDIIFLDGLVIKTVIGIRDDELHDPQPIRVDIAMGKPRNRTSPTDNIEDTIDYGAVRYAVQQLFVHQQYKLLESFAESIAQLILKDFRAQ